MNQTRSFLLIAWFAVAGLLYMEWIKAPVAPTSPSTAVTAEVPAPTGAVATGTVPDASAVPTTGAVPTPVTADNVAVSPAAPTGTPVTVSTDVLRLTLDTQGGTLVGAELLAYPLDKGKPEAKVRLLDTATAHYSVAQSGLLATAGGAAPTHESAFRTEDGRSDYRLADGAGEVEVPLVWTDTATGLTVHKTYVLKRGSYVVTVRQDIRNEGSTPWQGSAYEQLLRAVPPPSASGSTMTNPEKLSFVGGAWYDPEDKFEKIKVGKLIDDGPFKKAATGGWFAMLQHHFVLAWVPAKNEPQSFEMIALPGQQRYLVRGVSAAFEVAPGMTATREARLWVGPKLQEEMETVAPGLRLTLDYGIFTFIAQPMFRFILKPLHDFVTGNWGWAIILTVLIIKLILYPLSAAQYRSFAKMRAIQPKIEALKERYGDDRQKFGMAQMDLYKKEKINPMGGCLPILVTIPIFISLYWMLLESVEMRQAPWVGWIQNLTAPDPYFVLPVINLAVMFLTQKMTPTPGMDPMQKKIMTFMPLIFGVMMAFFPAGLVLYWCTNGLLGLLQQWIITRRHGNPTGTGTSVVAK